MKVEFLVPAEAEYREAFDWYQARSVRAAEGFRNAVSMATAWAMEQPTAAGFLVSKRVRKV